MIDFQHLREKLSALPVYPAIDGIVASVVAGRVTVVAASTGSGKSMLLPSAVADVSDHQIVVMVPRRFLATDAAYNVAELSGIPIGEQVGYALGKIDSESSQKSDQTKVLYCTYGYALSSGLINKALTLVLDEVHEADEQISLARAILRERKSRLPTLRILEMSATVDAHAQARFWHPIAETSVHVIEGQALSCDIVHESTMVAGNKDRTAEQIVIDLLAQGRKGLVLFRPGVKEVENSVLEIRNLLSQKGERDVEVVGIHGGTPSDERRAARRAPIETFRKVIVGTNVIESGVNLRWLDAGVSDGFRKVPYHRDDTGADALVLEDLPQAGILQQMGRVNRDPVSTGFERGLFLLHSRKSFEMRRPQNGPAIQRQSLNSVAFRAAGLGFDPTKLKWDVVGLGETNALTPRFQNAKEELIRLDLIDVNWTLTQTGQFVRHLPVSPETGALLWTAKTLDERRSRDLKKPARAMADSVILAAIRESHGLRKDQSKGHKGDQLRTSDLLDGLNAFKAVRQMPLAQKVMTATETYLATATEDELATLKVERAELEDLCAQRNMTLNGFSEVARLTEEITARTTPAHEQPKTRSKATEDVYDAQRYGELQQCILAAHINQLFLFENDGFRDLLRDYGKQRSEQGQAFNGYQISRDSIITLAKDNSLVVGRLRELPRAPKSLDPPLFVITEVTAIPLKVFLDWLVDMASTARFLVTESEWDKDELRGRYAGRASFSLAVPAALRALASQFKKSLGH